MKRLRNTFNFFYLTFAVFQIIDYNPYQRLMIVLINSNYPSDKKQLDQTSYHSIVLFASTVGIVN